MTSLFVPVITIVKIQNNLRVMSALRINKVKTEISLHESTFDGSADTEYISLMEDDGSYGSGEENSQLESQAYLEPSVNTSSLNCNGVAYKLIPVASSEDTVANMQSSPPHDTYFVSVGNPVEVYATTSPTPKKIVKREAVSQQSKVISAKKRDDKRRATHNEVERRRRDKINTWIMKLAAMVPNSGLPDSASKGGILAKACDHIAELNEKQKRLEKLEVENEKLVLEVLRLNQELVDLRKENTSVRNQLADNCIVFSHRQKDQKS